MKERVLIISFSGRKSGNCRKISDYLWDFYGDSVNFFDFSETPITPCGGCGYECFQDSKLCPYYSDPEHGLLEQICLSDLVYFIVPNYCDHPCANFFIFNERSQVYFRGHAERLDRYIAVPKKFIVVSNTNQENFIAAFRDHVNTEPDVLFLSAKALGKNSIDGDLMDAIEARAAVNRFVMPRDMELD